MMAPNKSLPNIQDKKLILRKWKRKAKVGGKRGVFTKMLCFQNLRSFLGWKERKEKRREKTRWIKRIEGATRRRKRRGRTKRRRKRIGRARKRKRSRLRLL